MNKIVCKIKRKIKGNTHFVKVVLSKVSFFTNLVSFESLLNLLLDKCKNLNLFKSRQDVPFVVLGHEYNV